MRTKFPSPFLRFSLLSFATFSSFYYYQRFSPLEILLMLISLIWLKLQRHFTGPPLSTRYFVFRRDRLVPANSALFCFAPAAEVTFSLTALFHICSNTGQFKNWRCCLQTSISCQVEIPIEAYSIYIYSCIQIEAFLY